jgi:hypothetical protein
MLLYPWSTHFVSFFLSPSTDSAVNAFQSDQTRVCPQCNEVNCSSPEWTVVDSKMSAFYLRLQSIQASLQPVLTPLLLVDQPLAARTIGAGLDDLSGRLKSSMDFQIRADLQCVPRRGPSSLPGDSAQEST